MKIPLIEKVSAVKTEVLSMMTNCSPKLPTNLGTVGCADGSNGSQMSKTSQMNRKDSGGHFFAWIWARGRSLPSCYLRCLIIFPKIFIMSDPSCILVLSVIPNRKKSHGTRTRNRKRTDCFCFFA